MPGELDRVLRVREIGLVEIQDDQQRLRRQELEAAQPFRVVRGELERAQGPAGFERLAATLQDLLLLAQLRGVGLLDVALEPFQPPFDDAEIGEDDLVFHRPHVARRVDRACRVRHRRIAEHPDHVQQGVGVAERRDVEQRLRAGLGAPRAGDVREFHGGRHALARIEQSRQLDRGGRRALEPHRRSRPPCRHAAVASLMLVRSWKSDVLPEEGKPIRPARNIGKIESTAPRAPAPAGHASAALPRPAEPGSRPLHYGPLRLPNLPRMAHPATQPETSAVSPFGES